MIDWIHKMNRMYRVEFNLYIVNCLHRNLYRKKTCNFSSLEINSNQFQTWQNLYNWKKKEIPNRNISAQISLNNKTKIIMFHKIFTIPTTTTKEENHYKIQQQTKIQNTEKKSSYNQKVIKKTLIIYYTWLSS